MASKSPGAKPVKPVDSKPVAAAKPVVAKVEAPKPAPVAAKPEAPKPAPVAVKPAPAPKVEAPKPVAKPVEAKNEAKPEPVAKAAAPVVKPAKTPGSAVAAPKSEEVKIMDTVTKTVETAKKATAENTERAKAMFGDMNARTKDAVAKGTKAFEEINEFTKGNIEAMVASSKIAAKGAEEIAKYSADYGRKAIEQANDNAKKFAAVKSPTEFFQLQSELIKASIDAMVTESSKFSENYLKLLGEIAQPVSNRVAVAVEKVKIAA